MEIRSNGKLVVRRNREFSEWMNCRMFHALEDVVRHLLISRNVIIKVLEGGQIREDTAIAISNRTGLALSCFNIKPRVDKKLSAADVKEIRTFGDNDLAWLYERMEVNKSRLEAFRNGDTSIWQ